MVPGAVCGGAVAVVAVTGTKAVIGAAAVAGVVDGRAGRCPCRGSFDDEDDEP